MNLSGKRLLIMGGSRISTQIVNKAREMGVYTIVTDWYDYDKSPAKQVADKAFQVSTTDVDALLELINKEKINGILTGFTDSTLPHYAKICEAVNFPCYGTEELFRLFTDKKRYKPLLEKYDIPTINEYKYTYKEILSKKIDVKYPVLVKPSDGSGGKGVTVCHNYEELLAGYEIAQKVSETENVLIERFIQGDECTLFFLFDHGDVYLSGLANRHTKRNQDQNTIPLVVGYSFPSYLTPNYIVNTLPKMEKMFADVGIKDGIMFAQCLIDDDEVIIYDIGYRLTGSLEYILQENICGYNSLESMIRFSLTGEMFESDFDYKKIQAIWPRYAYNVSLLVKVKEKISEITGLEEIRSYPGVIAAVPARATGDKLPEKSKGTLQQISLRVFGSTKSQKELEQSMIDIYQIFDIKNEYGESIKLEGLSPEDLNGKLMSLNG